MRGFLRMGLVVAMGWSSAVAAPLVFDEVTGGDLSNDGNAPTALVFGLGDNRVRGTMGRESSESVDPDIFTFTVGAGQELTSIFLHFREPAENSFYAIAGGGMIATDRTHPGDGGRSHLSNLLVRQNGELIFGLAESKEFGGASSSRAPLGPGVYTAWFQELSARVTYDFSYVVVPEPGVAGLLSVGAGLGLLLTMGSNVWKKNLSRRRGDAKRSNL